MKKSIIISIFLMLLMGLTACGNKDSQSEIIEDEVEEVVTDSPMSDKIGDRYMNAFLMSQRGTSSEIVDELIATNIFESELVPLEVQEGFLDGFNDEVRGFSTGVKFSPMIGSIPFVGYVFETEDPESLQKQLEEKADPNWNICTFADETVITAKDNLVFFMMCSNE